MKAKKLTRKQKELLSSQGWDPQNYLCVRDLPNSLTLLNKGTDEVVIFGKNERNGEHGRKTSGH